MTSFAEATLETCDRYIGAVLGAAVQATMFSFTAALLQRSSWDVELFIALLPTIVAGSVGYRCGEFGIHHLPASLISIGGGLLSLRLRIVFEGWLA